MNKPKDQGTKAESRIVAAHLVRGLGAVRLPEGGRNDLGDVEIQAHVRSQFEPIRIVGEVRDRERMNAAEALERAVAKSKTHRTALFWTQRVPIPLGGIRARKRRCVVITEELWFELIGGKHG
jgi:hypothetical protein